MDKEKAYELFKGLLKEFREAELCVRNDRSTDGLTWEEEEAEVDEICKRYDKEMKALLGINSDEKLESFRCYYCRVNFTLPEKLVHEVEKVAVIKCPKCNSPGDIGDVPST